MRFIEQLRSCYKCQELASTRKNVVIGDGAVPAPCVFLGEAPGEKEDETGKPFVGRSGILLRTAIDRAGFRPHEYSIINCLKCRPPENRNPTEEELANCRPFLIKQLEILKPKLIVALGKYAHAFVLGQPPDKMIVGANSGKLSFYKGDVQVLMTYHPAYVSRHQSDEVHFAFLRHIGRAKRLIQEVPKK